MEYSQEELARRIALIEQRIRESKKHLLYDRIRETIFAFTLGCVLTLGLKPYGNDDHHEIHHDHKLIEIISRIQEHEQQEQRSIDSMTQDLNVIQMDLQKLLPPPNSKLE